jgi:hypothetical protein
VGEHFFGKSLIAAGLFCTQVTAPLLGFSLSFGQDQRLQRLRSFFNRLDSPAASEAREFIRAADENGLDWRLLPSIAVVETGGGKKAPHFNIFGWKNGREKFHSMREAIHTVARALARSKTYQNKNLRQVLETYNPGHSYPSRVIPLMRTLGPAEPATL